MGATLLERQRQQRRELARAVAAGSSVKEAAERFGVHPDTVIDACTMHGVMRYPVNGWRVRMDPVARVECRWLLECDGVLIGRFRHQFFATLACAAMVEREQRKTGVA